MFDFMKQFRTEPLPDHMWNEYLTKEEFWENQKKYWEACGRKKETRVKHVIKSKNKTKQPKIDPQIETEALEVLLQLKYKKSEAREIIRSAFERNRDIQSSEELLTTVFKKGRE